MSRLRYTEIYGGNNFPDDELEYWGNRVYLEDNCDIVSVGMRLGYYNDTYTVTALLYTDSGGAIGSLIATGEAKEISSGSRELKTFTLIKSVNAGYYWVLFSFSGIDAGKFGASNTVVSNGLLSEVGWSPFNCGIAFKDTGVDAVYVYNLALPAFVVNGTANPSHVVPYNPNPVNASGPGIDFSSATLTWEGNGDTYDVYGGGGGDFVLLASGIVSTSYALTASDKLIFDCEGSATPVQWRVDSHKGAETLTGDVWTFDPRPAKVTNPSPGDSSTGQSIYSTISWDESTYADSYDVSWQGGQLYTEIATIAVNLPSGYYPLAYGNNYAWRVDANNEYGWTTGDSWTFTTLDFDPPSIIKRLLSDGSITTDPYDPDTMYFTGENFMTGVRRLLVFSGASMWFESIDLEDA